LTLVMTDVFGAEGPPERFSSLLIRGAWAAAAADGSGLEDSCGMAQAFKFPTEAYGGSPRSPGLRSSHRRTALLDRHFQPVRSKPVGFTEYGPAPGSPQACDSSADAATAVPIPGPGDPRQG